MNWFGLQPTFSALYDPGAYWSHNPFITVLGRDLMLSALDIPPTPVSAVSGVLQDLAQESLPRTVTLTLKLSPHSFLQLIAYPSSVVAPSSSPLFSLSLSPPLPIKHPSLPSVDYDSLSAPQLALRRKTRRCREQLTLAHISLFLRKERSREEYRYTGLSCVGGRWAD